MYTWKTCMYWMEISIYMQSHECVCSQNVQQLITSISVLYNAVTQIMMCIN